LKKKLSYRRRSAWGVVNWKLVNCCTVLWQITLEKELQYATDLESRSRSSDGIAATK